MYLITKGKTAIISEAATGSRAPSVVTNELPTEVTTEQTSTPRIFSAQFTSQLSTKAPSIFTSQSTIEVSTGK